MKRTCQAIGHLCRWLAGGEPSILARCPTERMKYVAMGGTVAATSSLALVSATFTTFDFLHTSLAVAVAVGIGWALMIMTLDRWLIMSIRRQSSPLGTLALSAPRVALAVVVGLVMAPPIVLRIFNGDVSTQATVDKKQGSQPLLAASTGHTRRSRLCSIKRHGSKPR